MIGLAMLLLLIPPLDGLRRPSLIAKVSDASEATWCCVFLVGKIAIQSCDLAFICARWEFLPLFRHVLFSLTIYDF